MNQLVPRLPPPLPASAFDCQTRVLCGAACGAPLEAAVAGGLVRCRYCRANNVIDRRDDRRHRSARRLPRPAIEEAERIDRLRSQVGKGLELPRGLQRLLAAGQLESRWVAQVLQDWLATHKRVRRDSAAFDADRLFHLTRLLAPRLGPHHRRALLETALEALVLPRHRQLLRAELAREAVLEGNVAAAVSWLAPCDPYPADLQMDSAYRLSVAYVAAARDDRPEILALLGGREGEVPVAPERVDEAEVLRIHACERLVGAGEAQARLRERLSDPFRLAAVMRVLRSSGRLRLCGAIWPGLEKALFAQWDGALRAAPDKVPLLLSYALMVASAVGLGAALVWLQGGAIAWLTPMVVICALVALSITNTYRRIEHLLQVGHLSLGHLCSYHAGGLSARLDGDRPLQSFALQVAIETRDGPVRVVTRRSLPGPPALASYPVLYDPDAPHSFRILIADSPTDPLETITPLSLDSLLDR